jgi:hypothetical protein
VTKKKPLGYLVRGPKSPFRVGDPTDKTIDTPENHAIAKTMGESFYALLKEGLLHHCPGTGNWTTEGELTDFQDTFDLSSEQVDLERHLKELKMDRQAFAEYLVGRPHCGALTESFCSGIGNSFLDAATKVRKHL